MRLQIGTLWTAVQLFRAKGSVLSLICHIWMTIIDEQNYTRNQPPFV